MKISYTRSTVIALSILLVCVGAWFFLIQQSQDTRSLTLSLDKDCNAYTYSRETCELLKSNTDPVLGNLEKYLESPEYVSVIAENKQALEQDREVMSIRDVTSGPWKKLLQNIRNSQLASASRSLISGETESVSLHTLPENATVWDLVEMMVPPEYLDMIVEYREESDGMRHMLAYVEPVDSRGGTWALVIDPVDAYAADGSFLNPEKLITTLVHEFAHALSLNSEQINYNSHHCSEGVYEALEGCVRPGAYLQAFVDTFWSDILDEFLATPAAQNIAFYGKYRDRFVNSYAATDPGEDFAESFAYYVVSKKNEHSSRIADAKIDYFYTIPEFVTLRDYMRQQMVLVMSSL